VGLRSVADREADRLEEQKVLEAQIREREVSLATSLWVKMGGHVTCRRVRLEAQSTMPRVYKRLVCVRC
jgi:hypothetical protein